MAAPIALPAKKKSGSSSQGGNAKIIASALEKIAASQAPNADKQKAAATAAGLTGPKGFVQNVFGNSVVSKALRGLDMPRSFVFSAVNETAEALTDIFNLQGHEYVDASWGEFWKNATSNKSGSEYLHDAIKAQNKSMGKDENAPYDLFGVVPLNHKWGRRVAGFTLDVMADPFTYLAPQKHITKLGGEKGIARALFNIADDPEAAKLAQRISQEGTRKLSNMELQKVTTKLQKAGRLAEDEAIKGGTYINVPGTGRVAQRIGLSKGPTQVQVLPQALRPYTPAAGFGAAKRGVRSVLRGSHVSDLVAGEMAGMKRMLWAGTPDQARMAFKALDHARDASLSTRRIAQELEQEFSSLRQEAKKLNIDGTELQNYLAFDEESLAKLAPEIQAHVMLVRNLNEKARLYANDLVGVEWIMQREGWQPYMMSEEYRDLLEQSGRSPDGGKIKPASFEKKANIVEGNEFLGEKLVSTSEAQKIYGEPLTPRQQAERIIADREAKFGKGYTEQLFNPDYYEAFPAYIRDLTYRTKYRYIEEKLYNDGIVVDKFRTVFDPQALAAAAKVSKAKGALYDLRMRQKRQAAVTKRANEAQAAAEAEAQRIAGGAQKLEGVADAERAGVRQVRQDASRAAEADVVAAGATAKGVRAEAQQAASDAAVASAAASRATLELDLLDTQGFDAKFAQAQAATRASLDAVADKHGALIEARNELKRVRAVVQRTDPERLIGNEVKRRAEIERLENYIANLEDEVADMQADLVSKGLDPKVPAAHEALKAQLAQLSSEQVAGQMKIVKAFADGSRDLLVQGNQDPLAIARLARAVGLIDEVAMAEIEANVRKFKFEPVMQRAKKLYDSYEKKLGLVKANLAATSTQLRSFKQALDDVSGFSGAARTLDDLRSQLDVLEMRGFTTDPAVMQYVDVMQQIAQIQQKGYLLNPAEPGGNWYHGISADYDSLDLRVQRHEFEGGGGNTGQVDNFIGIHLAADDKYAELYAERYAPDGEGTRSNYKPKVATLKVRSDNPALYGFDEEWVAKVEAGLVGDLPALESVKVFGTFRGKGLRDLQNDMFERAIDMGAVTPQDLLPEHLFFPDEVPEIGWSRQALFTKGYFDTFDEINSYLDEGADLKTAIVETLRDDIEFNDYARRGLDRADDDDTLWGRLADTYWGGGGHVDDNPHKFLRNVLYDTVEENGDVFFNENYRKLGPWLKQIVSEDEYIWNKYVYEAGLALPDSTRARIGVAYKESMAADGFDSVVYHLRDARAGHKAAAITFHPSQMEWDIEAAAAAAFDPKSSLSNQLMFEEGRLAGMSDIVHEAELVARAVKSGKPLDEDVFDYLQDMLDTYDMDIMVGDYFDDVDALLEEVKAVAAQKTENTAYRIDLIKQMRDDYAKAGRDLVVPYAKLMDEARERINVSRNLAAEVEAKELGIRISDMSMDVQKAARSARENKAALKALEKKAELIRYNRRDLMQALTDEAYFRREADVLFTQADQIEAEARRTYAVAINEADKAMRQALTDVDVNLARRRAENAKHLAEANASSMRLLAQAKKAEADLAKAGKKVLTAEQALAKLKEPDKLTKMEVVVREGFREMGWGRLAPEFIVDALTEGSKIIDNDAIRSFLRHYDKLMATWKGYALMTPGFHFRNTFGGAFNNFLAGIDLGRYQEYRKLTKPYYRAREAGLGHAAAMQQVAKALGKDSEGVEIVRQLMESGLLTGGQSREVLLHSGLAGNLNPLSPDNKLIRANITGIKLPGKRRIPGSQSVENFLRGTLAIDVMRKGGGIREAMDAVMKYHFDYDDLSHFEKGFARRIVPFYTWARKNLPLQIEGMLTNPKAYTRMMNLKKNWEEGQEEEAIIPSWFGDNIMSFNTGFKSTWVKRDESGKEIARETSSVYLMPDFLPFAQMTKTLEPRQILASTSPIIKVPLELAAGKQFFSDVPFRESYTEMPGTWDKLGLGPALAAVGKARKNSDGKWAISDRTAYVVEQAMPLLARARRLAPTEEKFEQRRAATMASMLFGVGTRANTPKDQEGELYRRQKELQKQVTALKALGYIEDDAGEKKKNRTAVPISAVQR